ncbi:hypothetical protein [Silvibacterium sp.]|uniref:hypothetical protein n=1 Tax=Silvibacterium sp. TaxID=1964179 RepID=UPI0039E22C7D
MATNPILSELNSLSPGAKAALANAHQTGTSQAAAQGAPAAPLGMPAAGAPPAAPAIGLAPKSAAPTPQGSLRMTPGSQSAPPQALKIPDSIPSARNATYLQGLEDAPATMRIPDASVASIGMPAANMPSIKAPRGTLQGDSEYYSQQLDKKPALESVYGGITGSKFGQDHPIMGRVLGALGQIPATAADVVLSGAFPGAGRVVPGTTVKHALDLNRGSAQISQDVANDEKQAEAQQQRALTAEANTRIAAVPGNMQLQQQQLAADLAEHGLGLDASGRVSPLSEDQLTPELRAKLAGQWEAVPGMLSMNGEPLEYNKQTGMYRAAPGIGQVQPLKQPGESAAQDDQKYEALVAKSIEGQQLSPEDRAFVKAYRDRKTLGQQVTNFYANQRDQGKQDLSARQAVFKAYQPVLDSAERLNVMAKNYEDAVNDHNQQAMLSLLANHLGMTMGLQKGARLSRDIIQEAQQSMPYLQGLKAKFDKDGYLQGVTLSPEQMHQMVDLGRERYTEDVTKARNESQYLGATDDGPARTPNSSVINQYIHMAGGDAAKAKQLAAQDGWTVK